MKRAVATVLLCFVTQAQDSRIVVASRPTEPCWLRGVDRASFLSDVERSLSKVAFVGATFEQEKRLAIFKDVVRSRGVLVYRAPSDLRWEIREPFRSTLVVAGGTVGKFEYDGAKRRTVRLGRGGDALLSIMERIRDWFGGRFDATDCTVDAARKPAPLIRLAPRGGNFGGGLKAIDVALTTELDAVLSVTIFDKSGDTTIMRFSREKGAPSPSDAVFSTTDPADYDPRSAAESVPTSRQKG